MRIAVSGTHCIGKSTLIRDFIEKHPKYRSEDEPYYQLQEEMKIGAELEPCLDSFLEQLDYSINQLNEYTIEENIIFDRCPVDFLAYAMYELHKESIDIHYSHITEKFSAIKAALNKLDLIIFLPISKENSIEYTEENPTYRKAINKCFKKLYRDEICNIFPRYNHPKIVEIAGNRATRLRLLEHYLI